MPLYSRLDRKCGRACKPALKHRRSHRLRNSCRRAGLLRSHRFVICCNPHSRHHNGRSGICRLGIAGQHWALRSYCHTKSNSLRRIAGYSRQRCCNRSSPSGKCSRFHSPARSVRLSDHTPSRCHSPSPRCNRCTRGSLSRMSGHRTSMRRRPPNRNQRSMRSRCGIACQHRNKVPDPRGRVWNQASTLRNDWATGICRNTLYLGVRSSRR